MYCKNRSLLYSKIFGRNFFEIVIDVKGIDVSQPIPQSISTRFLKYISSLKNLVQQTGIFCLFWTRFLQATQAVKI